MDVLACPLLRCENRLYQLKYAFTTLKHCQPNRITNLSFRDPNGFVPVPSVEFENRELYLKYMEEVLRNKEQELSQLEESLLKAKQKQEGEVQGKIMDSLESARLS